MRWTSATGLGLMLALSAAAARAEPAGHRLRLLGAAPSAHDPAPTSFVLDLRVKPGDGEFQSAVEGWFASIVAPAGSGEVSGSCVEKRCALTTRTNGDLQARYEQGDVVNVAAYHNRDTGFARIVFTYPLDRADTFEPFDMIVQREFKVADDVKL